MATYFDNLLTLRDNIVARLAEITANPKPDYSLDGKSVSWSAYFNALMGQLEKLNSLIAQAESGPVWLSTQALT